MECCEDFYGRVEHSRQERPVRLGSLLFTMVEPRLGHEVAYNRWYERDHFYSGCMIGAYTLAGGRFVATRDCKAQRFGSGRLDAAVGSYLALYWILDGHYKDWDEWAVVQVNRLHAEGRMFRERDHIHTGCYRYEAEYNDEGSATPIELALDRRYGGVVAFILDLAPGKGAKDVAEFLDAWDRPGDVALLGSPVPLDERSPADVPESAGDHALFLSFSIEDPLSVWEERYVPLGRALEAAELGSIAFASPFLPVDFGTDRYTDQLR